ncbi:MAG: hypothetical protein AAFY56_15745 [Pseudomonadota bacterium]
MNINRRPKKGTYVVTLVHEGPSPGEIETMSGFSVEEIGELPGTFLIHLGETDIADLDILNYLKRIIGENAKILSALEDEAGHTLIPTGNITVFMKEELPSRQLSEWAQEHRLEIISQSKWQPKLLIVHTDETLTELVEEKIQHLREDPLVDVAEQEVLARYSRAN